MALTLRLPEELDRRLSEIAEAEHVSKHSLVLESVQSLIEQRAHFALVQEGLEYALSHDAEALERLADS